MDWPATKCKTGPAAKLLRGVRHIMQTRKNTPQLAATVPTMVHKTGNPALFIFERHADDFPVYCLFNFTATDQSVTPWALGLLPGTNYTDQLSAKTLTLKNGQITLPPYAAMWLQAQE